jgi:hypothetical protein
MLGVYASEIHSNTKEAREPEIRPRQWFHLVGWDRSDVYCECGVEFRY